MAHARRYASYLIAASLVVAVGPSAGWAQGRGPVAVSVAPVIERNVPPSLRLVGSILPQKSAVVAAEVEGIIASFDAEEGQYLSANDVICRVDPTVARLRVEEAQAALDGLQARLAELEAGERPEEIQRLEALVAETESLQQKWAFELKRVRDLYDRGQSSDKELHDTEMDAAAAQDRLNQARAQLERAHNGERKEVIARARQEVAAQRAVLQRLQRDLDKTVIRAPFPGALVAKRTEVGEWIDAGGPVCELVALDTVKIRVDVPERAIAFARVNEPATVEVEALGKTFNGKIARVIPLAAQAARTFPVEVDLPNPTHTLLPGMFVWAYVPAGPSGARLVVDKDAIVSQGTSKTIFVLHAGPNGQTAVPTPVTTGLELEGTVTIETPGIKAGDLVVTRGNERLFGPTPVRPLNGNPASQPTQEAARVPAAPQE